ncbi:RAD52 motif 1 (predicted), isoform CRA_b [Rattus norvegicus]|uniref:RAD52 motif 1 (Predicted), isoform CRA_b n=1 Tax=Rattus norvegicus TaxID=10116 RepID=A6HJE3_RAT|nr:RAD52 motif 1 (predicted), isoform CRA_b [Rattus norvegicus]
MRRKKRNPQFFCAVEVVLPAYGCTSPGVGISEEPLPQLEEGQPSFLTKRKTAQKLAFQAALSDAFQKLTIVVLESGRIAVEYRPTEEDLDARSEEELQNLIQSVQPKGRRMSLGLQPGGGRPEAVWTALAALTVPGPAI